MADHTHIEWTDATWNPITGCSVVSPGCTNCYAMRLAGTRLRDHASRAGLTVESKGGPVWNGVVRFNAAWLDQPLRWKKPRMIFVCAHGDLFHEAVPDVWIDRVFAVMALSPQHTFQVLTKRPERMREYLNAVPQCRWIDAMRDVRPPNRNDGQLRNVWLGVSVEDQTRADERIPILLDTPAAVRWISVEPLLGPTLLNRLHGSRNLEGGGDEQWWESCLTWKTAVVSFFFNQWGDWAAEVQWPARVEASENCETEETIDGTLFRLGKRWTGRALDGVTHDAMPEAR